ncbi:MAG: radical SAM protein, partial [Planctomycetales bacterium]|nr:radical SAM protein [Planctomycetales bacterium]
MQHWIPKRLRIAPTLHEAITTSAPTPRTSLLINPFYPKDPHASFGKHVLTPTLALTSVAASTPGDWSVKYWDENLLLGHPPYDPFPEVVGITVHLTFAERAYELARWYRARGAKIVLGGLHATSCPDEVRPHADSVAIGEGVQLWGRILNDAANGRLQREYRGDYRRPYRDDPPPRRDLLPRKSFLTTTSLIATRGCHNRCGFCYLATDGLHMPYLMRDVEQIVQEFQDDGQPYAVFTDNNLGSRPDYLRKLCTALRPSEKIWSAAVSIDVTDDPTLVREMALAGCTGVFVGFESLSNANITASHKKSPHTDEYARRVAIFHDHGIQVNGSFVFGFDHDRPDVFEQTVEWIEA